jgi:hypothetical protein
MNINYLKKIASGIVLLLFFVMQSYGQCTFSGLLSNYCTNSAASTLTPGITGGTFSGPGITSSVFSPSLAGPGTHTINYNICQNTYSLQSIAYAPSPTLGTGEGLTDDSESGAKPIGFTFNYFCTPYTSFYISSNGFIEFSITGSGCCAGQSLPNFTTPNNLIALCWTDLNPGNNPALITYTTLGTSPNRVCVISYNGVPYFSGGNGPIVGQIKLYETTNIIEIHTTSVPANTGYNKTMGIENSGGSIAYVVPGRNASSTWTATNEAYRWTPGASCAVSQTTSVSPSTISVVGNNSICIGATTTLTALSNVTYTWSSSSNSNSIIVTPAATSTYVVSGTNSFGCVASSAVTVTVDTTPTVTAISSNTTGGICPSKTVALFGQGATAYSWTGGITNAQSFTLASTQSFVVTGSNACGSATAAISVSIHPLPTVGTVVSQPTVCTNVPVTLTGIGNASTYTWSSGVTNGSAFFPNTTSSYTVTGTSALGCTNTAVATITVVTTPINAPLASPPLICIGSSSTLTATGATNYTWTTPSGSFSTSAITVSPNTTTSYTITKANSNCFNIQTLTVIVNPLPTVFALVTPTLVCASNTAVLSGGGALTYTWYAPSFTTTIPGPIVTPSISTTYTLAGSDGTCVNVTTVSLATNPNPTITIAPSSSVICFGQSVSLTASGANGYTWTSVQGTPTSTTIVQSPTASTLYQITGINQFSCTSGQQQVVIVNPLPTINAFTNKPLVCSGAPANLTVTGNSNSYQWDANAGNATSSVVVVNPLVTTIYTVTGTFNTTQCSNTKTIQVAVFLPTFAVNSPTSSCLGGTINLIATGALTYTWNGTQPFSQISVSPPSATVYVVAATSQSSGVNCISSQNVSVSIYANPTITAVSQRTLICRGETTSLTASGAETYSWSTTQTGSLIPVNPVTQTIYNVTGTDQNGCVGTTTVLVKVSTCVGIGEKDPMADVQIFPNPNNGIFTVKSSTDIKLRLVNELGQIVRTIELSEMNSHQVIVSEVANGIYFLKPENSSTRLREKIVINR